MPEAQRGNAVVGLELINRFRELPDYAQALLAARMVRRGVLAKYHEGDPERDVLLRACTAADHVCVTGVLLRRPEAYLQQARQLRGLNDMSRESRQYVRAAAYCMADAVLACQVVSGQPESQSSQVVRAAAQGAVALLGEDCELSRMETMVLLAADIEQLLDIGPWRGDKSTADTTEPDLPARAGVILSRLSPVSALGITRHPFAGHDADR